MACSHRQRRENTEKCGDASQKNSEKNVQLIKKIFYKK